MVASTKRSPRKSKASTADGTSTKGAPPASSNGNSNGNAPGSAGPAGRRGASPTTQPTQDACPAQDTKDTPQAQGEQPNQDVKLTPKTDTTKAEMTPPKKGTTESPPMNIGSAQHMRRSTASNGADAGEKKRKMTISDVETVQNLIEKCLQLYLTKDEVISVLREQATIDAEFTKLIWDRLEGENPQFFKCYNTRLKLKAQIQMFNHLLKEQAAVVRRMQEGDWNTYLNSSATASGIPLFQSGGVFGFEDQGMKVETMALRDEEKAMGIKHSWSLSDFDMADGRESESPWR